MSDDTRPSGQVNLTMLLSILIVGIIVLAGFYIYVSRDDGRATSPPVGQGAGRPKADDASGSRCGLPGYETSGTLTAPPANTTWERLKRQSAPKTPAGGPGEVTPEGDRRCFSRTPEGAVVAAANLLALSGENSRLYFREHMVEGQGRDAGMNAPELTDQAASPRLLGFRLVEYTGQSARVDLAVQLQSKAWTQVPMTWDRGDWKHTGTPAASGQLQDLAGFVEWGPS